ncbi:MAG TPA: hypothetical protein VF085_02875 [Solirubrobacterales bacterium]
MWSALKTIGSRRAAIVACVALVSSLLVLLIQRFIGSGDWEWADALGDFVMLVATTIIIVGLLDWYRSRRWQRAEEEDLRSLTLLSGLIASGWSSPKDLGPPDLDPPHVMAALDEQMEKLATSAGELDDLYRSLIGETDLNTLLELSQQRWTLEGYYLEGSRTRRVTYLSNLVEMNLPGLVERRDDPALFALYVALRDDVTRIRAAANHADMIIHEQVLMNRPPILEPYLRAHNESIFIDPIALLARVIASATDELSEQGNVAEMQESRKVREDELKRLAFANRCMGAVRNELQWVYDALGTLRKIIKALEADIGAAALEVGSHPQLKLAREHRSVIVSARSA